MKNNYLLVFLLCVFSFSQAQVVDLEKLSKGKLYSSDEIKDENNNIKGYFLLFENDKVSKETYELEYIVLDENLTKVTNGFLTEMKFESWLMNAEKIKASVSLYNNRLLIKFSDYREGVEFFQRYRFLDLLTNKLSEPFIYNKGEMKVNPEFDRKMTNAENNYSENLFLYTGMGLVVNSELLDKKENLTERYLAHLDNDFKEVWRYNYNNKEEKRYKRAIYIKSDEDVLITLLRSRKKGMNESDVNEPSVLFIDAKTGSLRKEFIFPDLKSFSYQIVDCKILSDKIYLAGNYSKFNTTGYVDDTEGIGLFNFVFEKKTGKLTNSHYLKWEALKDKLPVNNKGFVKKEGYLFPHKMLFTSDDKIIVVAETFLQTPITTNNMYFFELSDKLAFNKVFEVEKFRNKFPQTSAHSTNIKRYGLFDFIDYQDLGDDEYVFLINDNEKKSKNRKKSTLYGIVTYSDGVFKRETLELKTETSTKYISNAKNGYLLIIEAFDDRNKSAEFRLEKINY